MLSAQELPIACNMMPFGGRTGDGTPTKDAPSSVWASQLRQVRKMGFDYIDPTDAWIPLADLTKERLGQFRRAVDDAGLGIPSISMTRDSVVDRQYGEHNLANAHRLIDLAPDLGATVVNTGFMQATTTEQNGQIWFWLAEGHQDEPARRPLAVERIRELAEHARKNNILLSLEMYEDTYIGSADDAVAFIVDVNNPAVGINPDIGNLIRLHRPLPSYTEMFEKVLPYANFWHIKNYSRDYDPQTGAYSTMPLPLKYGYINYRQIIRRAIAIGYAGPFCCEHYGSDSLGVCAENRDYIRQVLAETAEG